MKKKKCQAKPTMESRNTNEEERYNIFMFYNTHLFGSTICGTKIKPKLKSYRYP
jgi:hypothetical protein